MMVITFMPAGQRPVDLIDTRHPLEVSRQSGVSRQTGQDASSFASIGIYNANEFAMGGPIGAQPIAEFPITEFGTQTTPTFRTQQANIVVLVHIMNLKDQQENPGVFYLDNLRLDIVENSISYTCQNTPNTQTRPGRYRFGFNGMENDDEVSGKGRHPQFGDYGYDPATAHRWNNDPITYPWQSPYATFNNNPILYSDPNGLEGTVRHNRGEAKAWADETGGKLEKINRGHFKVDISNTNYYKNFDGLKVNGRVLASTNNLAESVEEFQILSPQKNFYAEGYSPQEINSNPFTSVIRGWQSTQRRWQDMAKVSNDKPGMYSPPNSSLPELADGLDKVTDYTRKGAIASAVVGQPEIAAPLYGISKITDTTSLIFRVSDDLWNRQPRRALARVGFEVVKSASGEMVEKMGGSTVHKASNDIMLDKVLEEPQERTLKIQTKDK